MKNNFVKVVIIAVLSFLAGTVYCDTNQKFYPQLEINGETNKSALSYQPGEKMIFTFRLNNTVDIPENWNISYRRSGDDGQTFTGKSPANKPLVIETSLDKAGFVSVTAFLTDENDKSVLRNSHSGSFIAFFAGTAVHPEKLADCGEPADFDAFWARQKKRLAAVPFAGKTECKLVKTVQGGKIYEVSIPCAGPRPATGYLMVPDNAGEKSLPGRINFFGYGTAPQRIPGKIIPGYLTLILNAHGQKLGQNAEYYKNFFASIRSGKYNYAFDPQENKDPENCFFNGMVFRALRGLEYLKSRPEWDGKNLFAVGGSQGGLQVMWAAALDPDVTVALPHITWCCDLAGTAKAKRLHGNWRLEYVPELDYYDPVFMAKRIKKARVDITRAGLGDYTCPPSGLAVCYRNLATPQKSIRWVQGSNHSFVPKKSEIITWSTYKK